MGKKLRKDKTGAALVVAVVIMLLVMILSLSLALISSALYHTAFRQSQMEQCKEAAQGISREIQEEITRINYSSEAEVRAALGGNTSPLWCYLRSNLWQTAWPYYNEDEARHSLKEACRSFNLTVDLADSLERFPGNVTVDMYWESERGESKSQGVVTPFFVRVTCAIGKQKSTITSEYELNIEKGREGYDVAEENLDYTPGTSCNPEGNTVQMDEKWDFYFIERD